MPCGARTTMLPPHVSVPAFAVGHGWTWCDLPRRPVIPKVFWWNLNENPSGEIRERIRDTMGYLDTHEIWLQGTSHDTICTMTWQWNEIWKRNTCARFDALFNVYVIRIAVTRSRPDIRRIRPAFKLGARMCRWILFRVVALNYCR